MFHSTPANTIMFGRAFLAFSIALKYSDVAAFRFRSVWSVMATASQPYTVALLRTSSTVRAPSEKLV
jgi:hypothetical protein